MQYLSLKFKVITAFCLLVVSINSFAQQGQVTINQDRHINTLLNLKKDLNKEENNPDRYKIQIYNGNRADALEAQKDFRESFSEWKSRIEYEPPNFKIWAGNFRTRLEADRALKKIKRKFPSAFIFKPKKERD